MLSPEEEQTLKRNYGLVRTVLLIVAGLLLVAVGTLFYLNFLTQEDGKWKVGFTLPHEENKALHDETIRLKDRLEALETAMAADSGKQTTQQSLGPDRSGLWFEVQIGAFKKFSMNRWKENMVNMGPEEDGYHRLTIGFFRSYKDAVAFKEDIQRLGVKDAFIVPKQDGKRINIKQALSRQGS